MALDLTVVVLTLNEEKNIRACLTSVKNIAKEIVVIDSFSSDRTVDIAIELGARVVKNPFRNYSEQKNFALRKAQIQTEWVLFLDADEKVSNELIEELKTILTKGPSENGFKVRFRLIWQGSWIRSGYYGTPILRLMRVNCARCGERSINEKLEVDGKTGVLRSDLIHEDLNGIERWHIKHLKYAELEALEYLKEIKKGAPRTDLPFLKRWIYFGIWNNLPLFVRPWIYFFYRYLVRGGFLDGWQGTSYHFFQSLWFQYLISYKVKEIQKENTVLDSIASKPANGEGL
jgi:glycosyltransferase involved in cell wall biosynthesis